MERPIIVGLRVRLGPFLKSVGSPRLWAEVLERLLERTDEAKDSVGARSKFAGGEFEVSDVLVEPEVSLSCFRPGPSATVMMPSWFTAQRVTWAELMTEESCD